MSEKQTRRGFLRNGTAVVASGLVLPCRETMGESTEDRCTLETATFRCTLAANGQVIAFEDKQTGNNFVSGPAPLAEVRLGGRSHAVTRLRNAGGELTMEFGDSGVRAVLRTRAVKCFLVLEVVSMEGPEVEEFSFVNIGLKLKGSPDEPFAACALAMNLKTNVVELPRATSRLHATCYPQFGFVGAKAALVGCPPSRLREALQEAVLASPELPHSKLGGPWALDAPINRGSYLFNFDGITEQNVDHWIELAKSLGMSQIDFHGGHSFRFGDCRPNPDIYPKGVENLKPVIDRLHSAGIAAGLHTYAFFIAKTCPWVTPEADERLAHSAVFTLRGAISAQDATLPVEEPTGAVSTTTGFFVRNSVTLRVGKELIVFSGVSGAEPHAFTGCQRGAHGTRATDHPAGSRVFHLKECFGLFVPDPHSTLFDEVANCTAETFNTCGFDMIYLDALDGSDILSPHSGGGGRFAWHYGAKFAYEICNRLSRPALMEMSTFHHHLWCVRSRYCAWDHPNRSYKRFVDIHLRDNETNRRMFLPGEMGWWALKNWTGAQAEPTYSDDIEYLMTKCLATDTGFALMGIDPNNAKSIPSLPRLGGLIRRYEDLRHSGKVPASIKDRLREPGQEFTLAGDKDQGWQFSPVQYHSHRVEESGGPSSSWRVSNSFDPQPVRVRISALMAAGNYDLPDNKVVASFEAAQELEQRIAQSQVTGQFRVASDLVQAAGTSGLFAAKSEFPTPTAAWLCFEKTFSPPLDISQRQALGLWIHGDGQGELLNIQLRSPEHLVGGIGDHYVVIDFTGWRYFELIEPEGSRYAEYTWPYGNIYSIYRESVQFGAISTLGVWLNNLPVGKEVRCHVSPIKAVPLVATRLIRPSISVGDRKMTFPVEIESGAYLEFNARNDCKLYGPKGELLSEVAPEGDVPDLAHGDNPLTFSAESPAGIRARALVSVITQGKPL